MQIVVEGRRCVMSGQGVILWCYPEGASKLWPLLTSFNLDFLTKCDVRRLLSVGMLSFITWPLPADCLVMQKTRLLIPVSTSSRLSRLLVITGNQPSNQHFLRAMWLLNELLDRLLVIRGRPITGNQW